MNIQGKDCRLTLYRDGTYTPVPYTLETIKSTPETYELPATVGERKDAVMHTSGNRITGCFITFVNESLLEELEDMIKADAAFDIIQEHGSRRTAFRNVLLDEVEIYGEYRKNIFDTEEIHAKVTVRCNTDSFAEKIDSSVPSADVTDERYYTYSETEIVADEEILDRIYGWKIRFSFTEDRKTTVQLLTPLDDEMYIFLEDWIGSLILKTGGKDVFCFNGLKLTENYETVETSDDVLVKRVYTVT